MNEQKPQEGRQPDAAWPPAWPDITDRAVLAAVAAVPRHLFIPARYRAQAYADVPLPIGHDQTISQPYIVALMTQALRLRPGKRVLEIGTGSGYQAAVLAQLGARVYSVETRAGLAEPAARRLHELGYAVAVKIGDGCLGWPEHAPYDAIIVTAAPPEVPGALIAQLADRGRLVIPVGAHAWDQRLWLFRSRARRLQIRLLAEVRFVPLVGEPCADGIASPAQATLLRNVHRLVVR